MKRIQTRCMVSLVAVSSAIGCQAMAPIAVGDMAAETKPMNVKVVLTSGTYLFIDEAAIRGDSLVGVWHGLDHRRATVGTNEITRVERTMGTANKIVLRTLAAAALGLVVFFAGLST